MTEDYIYYPTAEELNRVTLQVGLVGADGIILASDTCMTDFGKALSTSKISKLVFNRDYQFVYCFAGDDCAVYVGQDFEEAFRAGTFDKTHIRECLQNLANQRVKREKEKIINRGANWSEIDRRLTIAFYGPEIQLWQVRISENSIACQHHEKVAAGSSGNTARFFIDQYYSPNQSVWDLLPLAAHFILMGGIRASDSVKGFECYVVSKVGVVHLNESHEVVEELRAISQSVDAESRRKLTKWNFHN